MNDKELADKVVAKGVGVQYATGGHYAVHPSTKWVLPEQFVRDWRVAGALMEMAHDISQGIAVMVSAVQKNRLDGDPLPRAISEKCVEVLND